MPKKLNKCLDNSDYGEIERDIPDIISMINLFSYFFIILFIKI